jgi:hypothetical protein
MLNRFFNLARRQKPQTFPPRKRAMTTTSFGRPSPEDADLATFVVEDAEPGATPFAGLSVAAPSAKPVEGPGLALGQMRLAIEDGLLMAFGPEADPVPPHAFAAAAAAHPDAPLALPDGTTAPASRVAAVLGAQSLGRLGAADQAAGWILAMLREGRGPEPASEDRLRAEQGAGVPGSQPTVASEAGGIAAGAPPGGERAAGGHELPAAEGDAAPPTPRDEAPASCEALAQASLDQAAAPVEPDVAPAPVGSRKADAEPAALAGQADLDPDSMVLVVMHGVPEDARLSTGVRDDDGAWSISPLDLPTVTISLAPRGDGEASGVDGNLRITGIALAEDGELVATSETVPLADYLGDPDADAPALGAPAPVQDAAARPADDAASTVGPRMIALELNPPALAGEAFDALVIRDLPAGARLSAGAYDPAIDGWVLRPQDLGALKILPSPGLRGNFTVTLLGIALRQGDANATRLLARLPVRLA